MLAVLSGLHNKHKRMNGRKLQFWCSTVHRSGSQGALLSLVLLCRRSTCDIATGTACDTVPIWEQKSPATETMSAFTSGMPAKSNSSQLRRRARSTDWHDLCCRQLQFSYRNGMVSQAVSAAMSQVARRHIREPGFLSKIALKGERRKDNN